MPQPPDLRVAMSLPPERAVEYFKSKGYAVTANWHDLWQEAHAKSFTVAGAMRMDVLQDIRGEVDRAIAGEITQSDFIKNLRPRLQAKGWWGPQVLSDPETGDARIAQAGSPRRLKTIFRTNLQAAFMAGRYKQMMENVRFRPYWQYVAIMDQKTRPAHAAMNGLVFHHDDPFWMSFFPPNGFNCRCTVRPLSFADMEAQGISTSVSGKYLRQAWVADPTSGLTERVSVFKTPSMSRAGRTDLGWNYNPGRAAWQPDLNAYDEALAKEYVARSIAGPDFARFLAGNTAGEFPIAVLTEDVRMSIGTKSQAVLFSAEALVKNKAAHPDLLMADYRRMPQVIEQARLLVQDGVNTIAAASIEGTLYAAVIKAAADGKALLLTSFRSLSAAALRALRGKGKVLKDELEP